MNREALDAWFAEADDVLTDWNGGTDAMHSEPSKGEQDLRRAESYYEQGPPSVPALPGSLEDRLRAVREELEAATARFRVALQDTPNLIAAGGVVSYRVENGPWRELGYIARPEIADLAIVSVDPASLAAFVCNEPGCCR